MWNRIVDSAERFNEPGVFSAIHGFEWSSGPNANNLHRVVMFRDDAGSVEDLVPFSTYDSSDPEDLWDWLEAYEDNTGGQVMAFAHNGNLSNGMMFMLETFDGEPFDKDYAERRQRFERVVEVTQPKGTGEAHPLLSPDDELADFELMDKSNLTGTVAKTPEMIKTEYAREALKLGLAEEARLGVNPFKFGMIGSTDSHTSLATTREDNFFGKATPVEPGMGEERYMEKITGVVPSLDGSDPSIRHYESLASGLAAVWARENTREAIFDAMQRKEVYATTGSRMLVRFFGGWNFSAEDTRSRTPGEAGYTKGVPMGGDLTKAPEGKAPTFLVAALKDPIGANLDRYQIVKGWMDSKGKLHEKVYDVVWSGDRKPGEDDKLPAVGNTVDVKEATWANTIGATELIAVWKDPDFNPEQPAFYYGRVIEIPTPRWTAYDAKYFGLQMPPEVPMTTQERAYTSPIWYTP